jgi:hypothetical protein
MKEYAYRPAIISSKLHDHEIYFEWRLFEKANMKDI